MKSDLVFCNIEYPKNFKIQLRVLLFIKMSNDNNYKQQEWKFRKKNEDLDDSDRRTLNLHKDESYESWTWSENLYYTVLHEHSVIWSIKCRSKKTEIPVTIFTWTCSKITTQEKKTRAFLF